MRTDDGVDSRYGRSGPTRAGSAIALALAAGLAAIGCGDDEPLAGGDRPPGEERGPRLEGRYAVTFAPLHGDRESERLVWLATPRCETGACRTTARTAGGDGVRLRYDAASDRYLGRAAYDADCGDRRTGRLLVEGAYRIRARLTLTPTRTRSEDAGEVVTTFRGRSRRTLSVRPSALRRFRCTVRKDEQAGTDRVTGELVE